MSQRPTTPVIQLPGAAGFDRVLADLADFRWRPEIQVDEIPAPQRIAPFAAAMEALVEDVDTELGSGRLIILHDPQGNSAWQGDIRFVSYVRADVDLEMASDPLLAEVGWSWLSDALDDRQADYVAASGTVTSVASRSFGELAEDGDRAEIEIRASWTPIVDGRGVSVHLAAWQDLLCHTCALPPVGDGIVALNRSFRRG